MKGEAKMGKHFWSMDEDLYCCEECIKTYVIEKSDIGASKFLQRLKRVFPDIAESSLKMKLQNIKQLFIEHKIFNTLQLSPLQNYSRQNKIAFQQALKKEFGLWE